MADLISSVDALFSYYGATLFILGLLFCFTKRTFKFGVLTMLLADIPLALAIAFPRKVIEQLNSWGFQPQDLPDVEAGHTYGIIAGVVTFVVLFALRYLLNSMLAKRKGVAPKSEANNSDDAPIDIAEDDPAINQQNTENKNEGGLFKGKTKGKKSHQSASALHLKSDDNPLNLADTQAEFSALKKNEDHAELVNDLVSDPSFAQDPHDGFSLGQVPDQENDDLKEPTLSSDVFKNHMSHNEPNFSNSFIENASIGSSKHNYESPSKPLENQASVGIASLGVQNPLTGQTDIKEQDNKSTWSSLFSKINQASKEQAQEKNSDDLLEDRFSSLEGDEDFSGYGPKSKSIAQTALKNNNVPYIGPKVQDDSSLDLNNLSFAGNKVGDLLDVMDDPNNEDKLKERLGVKEKSQESLEEQTSFNFADILDSEAKKQSLEEQNLDSYDQLSLQPNNVDRLGNDNLTQAQLSEEQLAYAALGKSHKTVAQALADLDSQEQEQDPNSALLHEPKIANQPQYDDNLAYENKPHINSELLEPDDKVPSKEDNKVDISNPAPSLQIMEPAKISYLYSDPVHEDHSKEEEEPADDVLEQYQGDATNYSFSIKGVFKEKPKLSVSGFVDRTSYLGQSQYEANFHEQELENMVNPHDNPDHDAHEETKLQAPDQAQTPAQVAANEPTSHDNAQLEPAEDLKSKRDQVLAVARQVAAQISAELEAKQGSLYSNKDQSLDLLSNEELSSLKALDEAKGHSHGHGQSLDLGEQDHDQIGHSQSHEQGYGGQGQSLDLGDHGQGQGHDTSAPLNLVNNSQEVAKVFDLDENNHTDEAQDEAHALASLFAKNKVNQQASLPEHSLAAKEQAPLPDQAQVTEAPKHDQVQGEAHKVAELKPSITSSSTQEAQDKHQLDATKVPSQEQTAHMAAPKMANNQITKDKAELKEVPSEKASAPSSTKAQANTQAQASAPEHASVPAHAGTKAEAQATAQASAQAGAQEREREQAQAKGQDASAKDMAKHEAKPKRALTKGASLEALKAKAKKDAQEKEQAKLKAMGAEQAQEREQAQAQAQALSQAQADSAPVKDAHASKGALEAQASNKAQAQGVAHNMGNNEPKAKIGLTRGASLEALKAKARKAAQEKALAQKAAQEQAHKEQDALKAQAQAEARAHKAAHNKDKSTVKAQDKHFNVQRVALPLESKSTLNTVSKKDSKVNVARDRGLSFIEKLKAKSAALKSQDLEKPSSLDKAQEHTKSPQHQALTTNSKTQTKSTEALNQNNAQVADELLAKTQLASKAQAQVQAQAQASAQAQAPAQASAQVQAQAQAHTQAAHKAEPKPMDKVELKTPEVKPTQAKGTAIAQPMAKPQAHNSQHVVQPVAQAQAQGAAKAQGQSQHGVQAEARAGGQAASVGSSHKQVPSKLEAVKPKTDSKVEAVKGVAKQQQAAAMQAQAQPQEQVRAPAKTQDKVLAPAKEQVLAQEQVRAPAFAPVKEPVQANNGQVQVQAQVQAKTMASAGAQVQAQAKGGATKDVSLSKSQEPMGDDKHQALVSESLDNQVVKASLKNKRRGHKKPEDNESAVQAQDLSSKPQSLATRASLEPSIKENTAANLNKEEAPVRKSASLKRSFGLNRIK